LRGTLCAMELKYYDTGISSTNVSTTVNGAELDPPLIGALNCIAQGDGESNRDGRRIQLRSLDLQGLVTGVLKQEQADSKYPIVIRLWVVLDKQSNATQCSSEDVITSPVASAVNALPNPKYEERFTILMEDCIILNNSQSMTDGANTSSSTWKTKSFQYHIPLRVMVNFKDTAESMASIVDNSIHVIGVSNSSDCYVEYNSRVKFVG